MCSHTHIHTTNMPTYMHTHAQAQMSFLKDSRIGLNTAVSQPWASVTTTMQMIHEVVIVVPPPSSQLITQLLLDSSGALQ